MHSWRYNDDWVIFHHNETHPSSRVIIRQLDKDQVLTDAGTEVLEEMTVPWDLMLAFVADMLKREEQTHMDDTTAEEWLRGRLGVPRR